MANQLLQFARRKDTHIALLVAPFAVAILTGHEYLLRHRPGGALSLEGMALGQLVALIAWVPIALYTMHVTRAPQMRPQTLAIVHAVGALVVPMVHAAAIAIVLGVYYFGFSLLAYYDLFRDRMHAGYALGIVAYAAVVVYAWPKRTRTLPVGGSTADPEPPRVSASPAYLRRILVKDDGRMRVLPVEQIDWVEASDDHVVLHVADATHVIRMRISKLAGSLDPKIFSRIHRSTLINTERVEEVQTWFQGDCVVILKGGARLTVSRTYRDSFLAALER